RNADGDAGDQAGDDTLHCRHLHLTRLRGRCYSYPPMIPGRGAAALSTPNLAAGLAAGNAARAAAPPPTPSALAFADGRPGASLNGAWHVIGEPSHNRRPAHHCTR